MNVQISKKYGVPPNEVEKKPEESEEERLNYEFNRMKKVQTSAARCRRYDIRRDKKAKKSLDLR